MMRPNGVRAPEPKGGMHVRHYRQQMAGGLAFGCCCRGCVRAVNKKRGARLAKLAANAQVAEPFRALLNSFGKVA